MAALHAGVSLYRPVLLDAGVLPLGGQDCSVGFLGVAAGTIPAYDGSCRLGAVHLVDWFNPGFLLPPDRYGVGLLLGAALWAEVSLRGRPHD